MELNEDVKRFGLAVAKILQIALNRAFPNDNSYAFSAFGLVTLLLMLIRAGSGEAIYEIEHTLGGNIENESIKQILTILNQDPSIEHGCALFGRDVHYSKSFLTEIKSIFDAEVSTLVSSKQINNWCKKKTHGMIDKIIDEIKPDVKVILLDTLFFKANWEKGFLELNTVKRDFTKFNGTKHEIDMMFKKEKMKYWSGENASAVVMPYSGDTGVIAVPILPKKSGLNGMKEAIDEVLENNNIVELLKKSFRTKKVNISLPKLHIETNNSLNDMLTSMGIREIYIDAGTKKSFGIDTAVDDIFQKCVLEVNEEGTTAAAVTGATMRALSIVDPEDPIMFVLDRPFLFLLIHEETNLVLFGSIVSE